MPFQISYLDDLKAIVKDIQEDKENEAHDKFKIYLTAITNIGSFSAIDWPENWRKYVYDFGEIIGLKNGYKYMQLIDSRINETSDTEKEVLYFIKSEMMWNFFDFNKSLYKDEFKTYILKFPHNPEFYHSYSHFLDKSGNREEAVLSTEKAMRLDPKNQTFVHTYVNRCIEISNHLLEKDKFVEASSQLDKILKYLNSNEGSWSTYTNVIYTLQLRIQDNKRIRDRLESMYEGLEKQKDNIQSRLIEILGVFSGIMALILVNTSIATKMENFNNAFKFSIISSLLLTFTFGSILLMQRRKIELRYIAITLASFIGVIILYFFGK